jgi:hypothetical protein
VARTMKAVKEIFAIVEEVRESGDNDVGNEKKE